jgi:hypothetical protein
MCLATGCRVYANAVAIALAATLLGGCGVAHEARMFAPSWCGMDRVSATLFVERSMSAEARGELRHHIDLGRETVARFYGNLTADPYFVACATMACAERFGSNGEPAAALGDIAIRLAPNGETSALIAHEMSHAELYHRVGGWSHIRTIPRWFDEGIAVVVANEPKHSDEVWQEIRRRNLATPLIPDLVSRNQWRVAIQKFGETSYGDPPENWRLVYNTAAHEVRTFIAVAGTTGIQELLTRVHNGETFDSAYQHVLPERRETNLQSH